MIHPLIKFAQGMVQVILGVNKLNKIALYNLPLSIQILVINIIITLISLIFLIFFNYYLIEKISHFLLSDLPSTAPLENNHLIYNQFEMSFHKDVYF